MKWTFLPLVAALALAGCGGSGDEDFARTLNRPVNTVFASLGTSVLPGSVKSLFPKLQLVRTRPEDNVVLYTMSGPGGENATIRLTLEASEDGMATIVHAAVDVPLVHAVIDGKPMIISESKVEAELARIVDAAGDGDASRKLAELLGALTVATDKESLDEALKMLKDPARMAAAMAAMGGDFGDFYDAETDAETVDRPRGDDAGPQSNPDEAIERAETARQDEASSEERTARAAGMADDNAAGEAPEPVSEE